MALNEDLSPERITEFLAAARELAGIARSSIGRYVEKGFSAESKADLSIVTTADIETEKLLRQEIEKRFPRHGIIGEEFGITRPDADFHWILDPVDGTDEFVDGMPLYGTLLALRYRGEVVVGLIDHRELDLCLDGGRGIGVFRNGSPLPPLADCSENPELLRVMCTKPRNFARHGDSVAIIEKLIREYPKLRMFGCCYEHTAVLTDAADVSVGYHLRLWDIAATQCLVLERGYSFHTIKETPLPNGDKTYSVIFGKPKAVAMVRRTIGV